MKIYVISLGYVGLPLACPKLTYKNNLIEQYND